MPRLMPEGIELIPEKESMINELFHSKKTKKIVEVYVERTQSIIKEDGEKQLVWNVLYNGVEGYIPYKRSGVERPKQMKQYVGQKVNVVIVHVRRNPDTFVADRNLAIKNSLDILLSELNEGEIIPSVIKGVGENAMHVDIGGGCTVEISRDHATVSKGRVPLKSLFDLGQTIKVKVLKIDKENKLIQVSRSALLNVENEWRNLRLSKGDVITTTISHVNKTKNMVFGEIKEGIDAVFYQSSNIPQDLKVGDKVIATVQNFNMVQKRIRLIFKQKI